MRIDDGVEMLEIAADGKKIYPVLIWDDGNLALIDACYPGQIDVLKKEVEKTGFGLDRISQIIITHQDMDHIGTMNELLTFSPEARVFAHTIEADYLEGKKTPIRLAMLEIDFINLTKDRKEYLFESKNKYDARKTIMSRRLVDKEILNLNGGVEILHTPGHMPGHICLYIKKCRTLVTGDALNVKDGKLAGPNPVYSIDMPLAKQSLRKLFDYDIEKVISYHGGLYIGDFKSDLEIIIQEISI